MPSEPMRTSPVEYEPALHTLLSIYQQRPDLQASFPDAACWDFRGLVIWAAEVADGTRNDPATAELAPHSRWYADNSIVNCNGEVPWQYWQDSWNAAQANFPVLWNTMQDSARTAFNQHLTTLAMLITEFELKHILEVGTQYGHSTLALLEAARNIEGHVHSIDVEPCSEAKDKVSAAGLERYWTFVQGNALSLLPPTFPEELDLVFIDTFHLYSQTLRELKHFEPYLASRSWIVLHDAVTFPGVSRAVKEFIEEHPRRFRFYPYIHQHGLLLLRSQ